MPIFHDTEFTIDEEIKIPFEIGNIHPNQTLFPNQTMDDDKPLTYRILDHEKMPSALFNVSINAGRIYTAKRIDREELCFGVGDCVLNIYVLVTSSDLSESECHIVSVDIRVRDVNDNAPQFPSENVVLQITENSPIGFSLRIDGAIDQDYLSANKITNYNLKALESLFKTSVLQKKDGSFEIELMTLTPLDREMQEEYEYTITAYDEHNPSLSAQLLVLIKVIDVNDNAPIFSKHLYDVIVDKNTEVDSVIAIVSADDFDKGENGQISYHFINDEKSGLNNIYYINHTSGEITVIGTLKLGQSRLIVEARDHGIPSFASQTQVLIQVEKSKRPPTVVIKSPKTLSEDNSFSIQEPGVIGQVVAVIDVNFDSRGDAVTCITDTIINFHLIHDQDNYKLVQMGFLDFEARSHYTVNIVCVDNESPSLDTNVTVFIQVNDINDNAPIFENNLYEVNISKSRNMNNSQMLQVSAVDADSGQNGMIRYSMDHNLNSMFDMDSYSGIISVVGDIFKEKSPLSFSVYATDHGTPPMQTSTRVKVVIEKAEDNKPFIIEFDIVEEMAINSMIGNIYLDGRLFPNKTEGEMSKIFRILDHDQLPASLFNIERTTGIIFLAKRIDREEVCFDVQDCVLKFDILITSSGLSDFKCQVVSVHVTVGDINDNAPQFPSSKILLQVKENYVPDSPLKIHGATDRDYLNENKIENYALNGYQHLFGINISHELNDSSNIDLILLKPLDRELQEKYQFKISAYDGGVPTLSAELLVLIEVLDMNDNAPTFIQRIYNITIDTNTKMNSNILRVSAVDFDRDQNGEIAFDISNVQMLEFKETFSINSSTGDISIIGPLKPGTVELTVEARDYGKPQMMSQATVFINIDKGNTPPSVVVRPFWPGGRDNSLSIVEPGGHALLALIEVDDNDGYDNVHCSVDNDIFQMVRRQNRGYYRLSLNGLVDRETLSSFSLSISCVDNGNPPLTTTKYILVNVMDSNDNPPIFDRPLYALNISEGLEKGVNVLRVLAYDKDIGQNREIEYSMDATFDSMFAIDPSNGVISIKGNLDRESTPNFDFNVYATDQGTPTNQGTAQVSFGLIDINDNAPFFARDVFYFAVTVSDGSNSQFFVGQLMVDDADVGPNGEFDVFIDDSLNGTSVPFSITTNNSIVTSYPLDGQGQSKYTFSVTAKDHGDPFLMSTADVIIEIV